MGATLTGSDAYNQQLSEKRAASIDLKRTFAAGTPLSKNNRFPRWHAKQRRTRRKPASVRDYLVQQGIPISSVAVMGFGKTQPVASNSTAAGRQQNRRVELVVSGEVIGTPIGGGDSNLLKPQSNPQDSETAPPQPQR